MDRIRLISLWLAEARAPSFYFERDYGKEDARKAIDDASFVVKEARASLK